MKLKIEEIEIETKNKREIINIQNKVEEILEKNKIENGICLIFLPHSTAALIANEDEKRLKIDLLNFFEKLAPENFPYKHNEIDNNADSHLLSSIFKQFFIFPIENRKIIKGAWQDLMLAEFDGPRKRRIIVVLIGQ
ncbi:MAG: secondary thiamine-phosphate synthase enzyme YjbQ [Candidatus Aenigmatarchaeota archaeon]